MMDALVYAGRQRQLFDLAAERPIYVPPMPPSPRNYRANTLSWRQSSYLLWLTGWQHPELHLVIHGGEAICFAPPEDLDDIVWHGPQPKPEELAAKAGIRRVRPLQELAPFLAAGAFPRFLPPFRAASAEALARLLGRTADEIRRLADPALMRRMVALREIKTPAEVALIERALAVTKEQHEIAMREARPGRRESEVLAAMLMPAQALGLEQSYAPILSVRGEVLHNHAHDGVLQAGQLLLNDSGVEDASGYASDITRVVPVSQRFSPLQRDLYEVVLQAQLAAIAACRSSTTFREVHLVAARRMAEGLVQLGFLRGWPDDIVAAGAHALFFPHGIGHQLGLDVHDMEDLGDLVGYGAEGQRSSQFGLNFLRLARPLIPGMVVTVEPGIYFIPALIERWAGEGRHAQFIDYERVRQGIGIGGIRIEDDVLITSDGHRVLGPKIAKTVAEVEALRS